MPGLLGDRSSWERITGCGSDTGVHLMWKSARELAVERERWAVRARCGRGYTELLPDLAVWLKRSEPPVAVIAEIGGRREDRQKMILEGWRDAILSGRYAAVHFHCATESTGWAASTYVPGRATHEP